MTAETDIAAIDDGGANTAAEVRTALTSVLARADRAYAEISAVGNTTETAIAVAGTAVQVTIFDTDGEASGATPDHTNDHITIDTAAVYLVLVSATINSVAGLASRFEISVKKNNGSSDIVPHMDRDIVGGGGVAGVISMSGLADLAATDTVEVWIENETNTANYLIDHISLVVKQV